MGKIDTLFGWEHSKFSFFNDIGRALCGSELQ